MTRSYSLALLALTSLAGHASADVIVWDQPAFGVYGFGSSWAGGAAPGAGDTAQFGATIGTTVADVTVLFNVSQQATNAEVVAGNYDWRFGNPGLSYTLSDTIQVGVGSPDGLLPDAATLTLGPSVPGGFLGQVNTRFLQVGQQSGGRDGHLLVDGASLNVQSGAGFINGTAEFRNGAVLNTGATDRVSDIGAFGDEAEVTLTGVGTRWDHSNTQFWVGHSGLGGQGTLNVLNGASLDISNNAMLVGNASSGGTGHVLVDGAGSQASAEGVILGGNASLAVVAGATVTTSGPLFVNGSPNSGTSSGVTVQGSGSRIEAQDLQLAGGFFGFGVPGGAGTMDVLGGRVKIGRDAFLYPDGVLTVTNGAMTIGNTVPITGAVAVGSGGRMLGTSTINADVVNDGGTISPGFSPGALVVNGDLLLQQGRLSIEIGSLSDSILLSGIAELGGTLRVTDLGDQVVQPGDTFTFLTASSISGTFDLFEDFTPYGLELTFDDGVGMLVATVPGPATGWALALAGFACSRRRRGAAR